MTRETISVAVSAFFHCDRPTQEAILFKAIAELNVATALFAQYADMDFTAAEEEITRMCRLTHRVG